MPTNSESTARGNRLPEKKIGPFASGVGVAIWLNSTEADDGTVRHFRSITINPRRYFDRQTNEWKDAPSFQPADLPALIFSLQKAQEFVFEQPLPGQKPEPGAEAPPREPAAGEVPF